MRNCIAACVATLLLTGAAAQGFRPLSLPETLRWQRLQGQADDLPAKGEFALAVPVARGALAAGGFATGGRTYSRAHPFFRAPFVLVGD